MLVSRRRHYYCCLPCLHSNIFPPSVRICGYNPMRAHYSLKPSLVPLHNPCDVASHMGPGSASQWEYHGMSRLTSTLGNDAAPAQTLHFSGRVYACQKFTTYGACAGDIIRKKNTDYSQGNQVRSYLSSTIHFLTCNCPYTEK